MTSHNLPFLVAPWKNPEWRRYKVGTVSGLYNACSGHYQILTILNSSPGNGHFEDVLEWFENSCRRDNYNLLFLEVWNKRFLKHLIEKRGFKKVIREDQINALKVFDIVEGVNY